MAPSPSLTPQPSPPFPPTRSDPFQTTALDADCSFETGQLPIEILNGIDFEALWNLHPAEFPEIHLHGRRIPTPRWQQAYGIDYHFSGKVYAAIPIPERLVPITRWCQERIDPRLNGLLLNWYDGRLGHYIGRHRDSIHNLVANTPIVTVSLGEPRIFRLRPWPRSRAGDPIDFPTAQGSVFVLPWNTNRAYTHEVVKSARLQGRRISITLRAFKS